MKALGSMAVGALRLDEAEREAREARDALAAAAHRVQQLHHHPFGTELPAPSVLPSGALSRGATGRSWQQLGSSPREGDEMELNMRGAGYGSYADGEDERLRPHPQDPCAAGFGPYVKRSLYELLFTSHLNWLLLCTPFAFTAKQNGWSDIWIFTLSLLAIAPFAERLSFVTEQLALHTSQTIGGLLNATFGNVTELIVSLFALNAGLYRIVQVSLLGSILSNLLLVLGTAFLVGGLRHPQQRFNRTAQTASFGLLLLATMCMIFPMVLDVTHETFDADSTLLISRLTAVCMLCTYCLYLAFQLYTHTYIFADGDADEDDEEERVLGAGGAIFWLAVITVFIAYLSEYMVDAIRGAADELQVPDLFLGTIIIPIVGNAAEHAAAIIFAHKNKMELALGIAVGSATQIALFVVPACILIAWAAGEPLSMDFHPFESTTLLITVLLVGVLIQTGESHWLAGIILIVAYVVISIGFFFHVDLPSEVIIGAAATAPTAVLTGLTAAPIATTGFVPSAY